MVVSLRSRILFGYIILVAVIGSMAAIISSLGGSRVAGPPFSSMNLRSSTTYMRMLNNGIYTNSK